MTHYACGCTADGDLVAAHCPQHGEPERGATTMTDPIRVGPCQTCGEYQCDCSAKPAPVAGHRCPIVWANEAESVGWDCAECGRHWCVTKPTRNPCNPRPDTP